MIFHALLLAACSAPAATTTPTLASTSRPARSRYEVFMNERWPENCPVNLKRAQVDLPDWRQFKIKTNPGNAFLGPVVATIYRAGTFPHFTGMTKGDWNASTAHAVYGGIPQLVDLGVHLTQLRKDIAALLPDPDSSGVASIDWEAWKPNFKDNRWDEYWIYVNRSIALVEQQHPDWPAAKQ
jgi:hypothetical protein